MPETTLDHLRIAMAFIQAVRAGTLEDDDLDPIALEMLRNPPTETLNLDCPVLTLSLEVYLLLDNSSMGQYEEVRAIMEKRKLHMLSLEQVKRKAVELSGVSPMYTDMCVNTCIAYTGPYEPLDLCPTCGEGRYELRPTKPGSLRRKRVVRRQFLTIPLGPQLQAMYRSVRGADAMSYRARCTLQLLKELENGWDLPLIKDYTYGSQYLEAARDHLINDDDIFVMLSMDGAQLYAHKQSDCWIYIWVILEMDPESRYKKEHVLVGGIIPGPNKPGDVDSFLFPGVHHVSALMKEGFRVYDVNKDEVLAKKPFLAFATADGPGMCYLSGHVGHKGCLGCRLHCGMPGRYKPQAKTYYPATQIPRDYDVQGSNHPDIDLRAEPDPNAPSLADQYLKNLTALLGAKNNTEYKRLRRATGLTKPSIFSGLPAEQMFPIPGCFPSDIMHLVSINIPDLLFGLWRGSSKIFDKRDNKGTWDWLFLKGDTWKTQGQAVADTRSFLPGSFDRPPRNPETKMNSGYKAIEYLVYMYCLGPALFHDIMPDKYWTHFCKLVRGIRIVHQRTIHMDELKEAHRLLIEYVEEFETLYYQRKAIRLHFVRQSIHALIHMARTSLRIGPYIIISQWTMERVIGQLVRQLRQPSHPYANLSNRALRDAQCTALRSMYPQLGLSGPSLPSGALDLADGYALLRVAESRSMAVPEAESDAIRTAIQDAPEDWLRSPRVAKWGRLSLPTGQIARSTWAESRRKDPRKSCNVKVRLCHLQ